MTKPLFLLLCSGEHEKIQMAAMMASVAAVSERPVQVFVSMNAILAFARTVGHDQRYQGGYFSSRFKEGKVPDALELFGQGRMLGELKMWACAMVLDLQQWSVDDLVEGLFDGPLGLTRFLAEAEDGELVTI